MKTQCMGCMEMYDYELDACPHCGFKESEYKKIGYHLAPHSTLVDTYIVGKAIGYGGFGVTYVGYNAILEKKVAIKEYLPGEFATRSPGDTTVTAFTGDKEQAYYKGLEQFEQEAKRLAKLKNKDGIVDIYDSFRANNTVYIVMECLEGETVKELLKREKKLSVTKATNIIVAVLEALKEVHSEGIIHRDISPENIFITKAGEVKLIDFGAARNATTGLSKSLSVIVKQGYAPPEQYFSKGKQGTWTDVYATAATYYKMLTGITPEDSMERKGKETLISPSKLKVKLTKRQENALLNALELDVKNRTATVDEFLKGITDTKGKVKRTKVKREKVDLGKMSLRTKFAIVIGVVAVVAAFVVGYQVVRDNLISDQEALAENQVYVPNVLNMSYDEAEALLAENGLVAKIVKREASDHMPVDIVIEQKVASGEVVDKGIEIPLVISNGGAGTYVLGYEGFEFDSIIPQLDELELIAEFTEVESVIAPGCVISQDVPEYTNVVKGSVINFEISKGMSGYTNQQVDVPDIVGMQFEDALSTLEESNLYIQIIKNTYSDEVPSGQILSQSIKPRDKVSGGTIIEVEVCAGMEMVRLPDMSGMKISEAEALLDELGFTHTVVYEQGNIIQACEVIRLSEEADNFYEVGTDITIYAVGGVRMDAEIVSPTNETENVYKVGDTIKIEILLTAENTIRPAYTFLDIGAKYDKEYLQFEGGDGAESIEYLENDPNYGEMLVIGDSWTDTIYSNKITLTFTALKEGKTKFNIFTYIITDENRTPSSWGSWGVYLAGELGEGDGFIAETDDSVDLEIVK